MIKKRANICDMLMLALFFILALFGWTHACFQLDKAIIAATATSCLCSVAHLFAMLPQPGNSEVT